MKLEAQILTTPTVDTAGVSLVVRSERRDYIFGQMGEGMLRKAMGDYSRLPGAEQVFVTGKSGWKSLSGLLSMLVSMREKMMTSRSARIKSRASVKQLPVAPSIHVYGPPNTTHYLASCRKFVYHQEALSITCTDLDSTQQKSEPKPIFEDDSIAVYAMAVRPEASGSKSSDRHITSQGRDAHVIRQELLENLFETDTPEGDIAALLSPDLIRSEQPGAQEPGAIKDIKPFLPRADASRRNHRETNKRLPDTTPSSEALSYIIRGQDCRGRFDAAKGDAYGIPNGSLRGRLVNGFSVQNAAGETITPEMVMGPPQLGHSLAVLDVPSPEYVAPLLSRSEWSTDEVTGSLGAAIWILGPDVISDPAIQQFWARKDIKHIISAPELDSNTISFDKVARQAAIQALVDPSRFRPVIHSPATVVTDEVRATWGIPSTASLATPYQTLGMHPQITFQDQKTVDDEVTSALDDPKSAISETVLQLAAQARQDVVSNKSALDIWRSGIPRPDTEVVCLGTGSASVSALRNVSGHLIRVPGIGSYILDCGEGTLGQMARCLGTEKLTEVLRDLRMIWISHMHSDHHLGLVGIIKAWREACQAKSTHRNKFLALVAPESMSDHLIEYSQVEDFGYHHVLPLTMRSPDNAGASRTYLHVPHVRRPDNDFPDSLRRFGLRDGSVIGDLTPTLLGVDKISAQWMWHGASAQGVTLTFPPEKSSAPKKALKISYSGDCRPNFRWAAEAAMRSTLMIHEATFHDELYKDAITKSHSTLTEALTVARKARSSAVLLTHFSQRYQGLPDAAACDALLVDKESRPVSSRASADLPDDALAKDLKIGVAQDYMRFRLGDFPQLATFTPALQQLRADEHARRLEKQVANAQHLKHELEVSRKERESERRRKALKHGQG